ncbi:MAG: hypothetical protein ACF8R7_00930 [Phycisphaerales bacterium JB039]
MRRWFSSVRMVQVQTGWPRALCARFVLGASVIKPLAVAAGILVLWIGLPYVVWRYTLTAAAEYLGEDRPFTARVTATLAVLACFVFATFVAFALAMRTRWRIRRYLANPRCLKCKYPIQPPREPGAGTICPECGEPIPPEIARLAARDAEATERISE